MSFHLPPVRSLSRPRRKHACAATGLGSSALLSPATAGRRGGFGFAAGVDIADAIAARLGGGGDALLIIRVDAVADIGRFAIGAALRDAVLRGGGDGRSRTTARDDGRNGQRGENAQRRQQSQWQCHDRNPNDDIRVNTRAGSYRGSVRLDSTFALGWNTTC